METINVEKRNEFAERLFGAAVETLNIFTIFIGDQLGYYEVLSRNSPMTARELASRTGTHERYVREWLEQQTAAGILEVEDAAAAEDQRRFLLPPGYDEVLTDPDSLNYLAPLSQAAVGIVAAIDRLPEVFRTGGGIPFEDYGRNLREGQARMNRASFLYELGQNWLPTMADVDARLRSHTPARIADIGCGGGWSSIGMARSYPSAYFDGFDLDEASIELAKTNAAEAGVADRVHFYVRDAGDEELSGHYDLVTAFECIHDMSDPVAALRTMRRLSNETGAVLVMDERTGESFGSDTGDLDPFLYAASVLHCLPVGMASQPSARTGTVMRPDTFRRYAEEAGFQRVDILPIKNPFFRFYRLYS